MSVNKVILIGNTGADPDVRYLDGGVAVASIRLATSENYKNKNGERITQTEWHNIVLWRGLAEIAEKYVKKGMQLYIEGRLRNRSWDDKDGNKRYITEIVADNLQMLSRKEDENKPQYNTQTASSPNSTASTDTATNEDANDDLPF